MTEANRTKDRLCIQCRTRESEHVLNRHGALVCPDVVRYFTPCKHERREGFGTFSSDGSSTSDMTCMDCGERFVWPTP